MPQHRVAGPAPTFGVGVTAADAFVRRTERGRVQRVGTAEATIAIVAGGLGGTGTSGASCAARRGVHTNLSLSLSLSPLPFYFRVVSVSLFSRLIVLFFSVKHTQSPSLQLAVEIR